jgi:hypothetical protein
MNTEIRDHVTYLKGALDLITGATTADTGTATYLSIARTADSDGVLYASVSGDTQSRFYIQAGGLMAWGAGGSSAPDVQLYRGEADVLRTDDRFDVIRSSASDMSYNSYVVGDSYARFVVRSDGEVSWGDGSGPTDVHLFRAAADVLRTLDRFDVLRSSISDYSYSSYVGAEGSSRFAMKADGTMEWGSGTGGADATLYRDAAYTLKADYGLWAEGGLITRTKAGIPADGDLPAGMQQSGCMVLDTTNSRVYFRVGSTWKYAALT